MSEYKRCPCGAIPTELSISDEESKWAYVSCGTCGEWSIEFKTHFARPNARAILAAEAWNSAPRGGVES